MNTRGLRGIALALFFSSTALAQATPPLIGPPPPPAGTVKAPPAPANAESIIQRSGVMEEQASAKREQKRVDEAAKSLEEKVNALVEEVNKPEAGGTPNGEPTKSVVDKFIDKAKPANPYDYRNSEDQDPVTSIMFQPWQVLGNQAADYEQIGPHIFPNIMIPDIARMATNAAGFDEGTCYARKVNLQDWCAKILYMKVFGIKIPYGVRLTPSAEYDWAVSKAESAQRPFVTRYIPHMQVGWQHDAISKLPQELNAFLQLSSSYQALKNLSLMGQGGNLNLPSLPLAFGSKDMKEAAKAADELVREYPEKLRFVGQTRVGTGESVVVPELTSRMLKDAVNEQIPNYTLAITITIFSFNLATIVTLIKNIKDIMDTLKMSKQLQTIMKLVQQASYYKNLMSADAGAILKLKWKDLMKKLEGTGKTVADLDLQELGRELGMGAELSQLQDAISSAVESAGLALNVSVGIIKVDMLCHRPKRPASLDEWNPYTDLYASYFLPGDVKKPIGFYTLSRFPVLMQYKTELQRFAKAYAEFQRNPSQCSIIETKAAEPGKDAELFIKDAYPNTATCALGMPLVNFSPNAPSPYDPQQSMKGAWNGFTLAAQYRPDTFYQFDKDKDKFLWISADPKLSKECGPLFNPYQWSGSKNTEGHANIQLPEDQPNVAVQWRHYHCCVDPEASPFRGLGPIQIFASDWQEIVE